MKVQQGQEVGGSEHRAKMEVALALLLGEGLNDAVVISKHKGGKQFKAQGREAMHRALQKVALTIALVASPAYLYAECAEGGNLALSEGNADVYLVGYDDQGNGIYAGTYVFDSGFGGTADIIASINCDTNQVNWIYFPDVA